MSGFTRKQSEALTRTLSPAHVKTRAVRGRSLSYIEGWFAVAEANAIFGFAGWDREVLHFERSFERRQGNNTTCGYLARVRIRVRAGGVIVLREGTGFGSAALPDPAEAHELALKAAETDVTKRALATFGERFGLGLYDRDRNNPTASVSFSLRDQAGAILEENLSPEAFCSGLRQLIAASDTRATLVRVFAANRGAVRSLLTMSPHLKNGRDEHYAVVLKRLYLKRRAVVMNATEEAEQPSNENRANDADLPSNVMPLGPARASRIGHGTAIEKSNLPLATEYRARDKAHLHSVAAEPCVVCSQQPCHAHHLKFAQPRGLSQKVSDAYTVPLCVEHHNALHRAGNERSWWKDQGIDPLPIAHALWQRSRASDLQSGAVFQS